MSSKQDTILGCLVIIAVILLLTAFIVWLVLPKGPQMGAWRTLLIVLIAAGCTCFVLPLGMVFAKQSSFVESLKALLLGLPGGSILVFVVIKGFRLWAERWKTIQHEGGVYLVGEPIIVGTFLAIIGLVGLGLMVFGLANGVGIVLKTFAKGINVIKRVSDRRLP